MEESFAYSPFIFLPFIWQLRQPAKAVGSFNGFSNVTRYMRHHTRVPSKPWLCQVAEQPGAYKVPLTSHPRRQLLPNITPKKIDFFFLA